MQRTTTKLGEVDFGPSALIDLRARELQFFDRWLKGERNEEDDAPPVSIFVMGVNEWRSEQEWPLARTRYTPWYLHSGGRANSLFGDGVLSPEAPGTLGTADGRSMQHVIAGEANGAAAVAGQAEACAGLPEAASDTYVYDQRRPVPFITEPTSSQIGGPNDYTPVHRRDDVLVYTSEPLTEPLGLSDRMETAVQTVYHSAAYPSAIVLPVIPRQ
jgi:predicted acyl esterase